MSKSRSESVKPSKAQIIRRLQNSLFSIQRINPLRDGQFDPVQILYRSKSLNRSEDIGRVRLLTEGFTLNITIDVAYSCEGIPRRLPSPHFLFQGAIMKLSLDTRMSVLFRHAVEEAFRLANTMTTYHSDNEFLSILNSGVRAHPHVSVNATWQLVDELLSQADVQSLGGRSFGGFFTKRELLLTTADLFSVLEAEALHRESEQKESDQMSPYRVLRTFNWCTGDQCTQMLEALEEHFTLVPKEPHNTYSVMKG